jgi:uridine kinase
MRLEDMTRVGVQEVNMDLLNINLVAFQQGRDIVNKPLVDYHRNKILSEDIVSSEFDFCVVEGTYVSELNSPDYKIFIETTYLDTRKLRVARARDQISDFNEQVLEIEHQIIKPHHKLAHLIIDKDLNTKTKL